MRKIKITDFEQDDRNCNRHTEKGMELLENSIKKVGVIESITVSSDDKIISGNARQEIISEVLGEDAEPIIIKTDGTQPIILKRTDIQSGTKQFYEAAILANTTAKQNINLDIELIQEIAIDYLDVDIDIIELGVDVFNDIDFNSFDKSGTGKEGSLSERFIIPPFSILDVRRGIWQERKNAWLSLGIKSEIGRDENLTYGKSAQTSKIYEIRNNLRDKTGIEPPWEDVFKYCKSHNIPLQDGTSIFDPVLCELVYRWFNIPNGVIIDPFCGGSVRGIVASKLEMQYYGVDLRREQIEANYKNAKEVICNKNMPYWVCDDSMDIDKLFFNKKYDLIFSCPPYADLEVYSDNPKDLSNMEYEDFIKSYRKIINKTCSLLNDNRFAVFVVGEARNKTGSYYNFVSDTINAFQDAGLSYYNEMILATQIGSMTVRVSRQFNNGRKIGKVHQNVLVFYKGDIKQIKNNYLEIDFSEDEILKNNDNNFSVN
jgi:DNA modification methylase